MIAGYKGSVMKWKFQRELKILIRVQDVTESFTSTLYKCRTHQNKQKEKSSSYMLLS